MINKSEIQAQFSRTSRAYLTSQTHALDIDLDVILLLLAPNESMTVLDVATGAGHTALKIAPYVKEVIASDLTEAMLDRVKELQRRRSITNVNTVFADAAALPFEDRAFDAVTCRIAPHHFLEIQQAILEIARVLKADGVFILEDSVSPLDGELDAFINTIERARDRTHIRSYSLQEWNEYLAHARLAVEETLIYRKRHDIDDWIERAAISAEERQTVLALFRNASPIARQYYEITFDGTTPLRFTDDKVIMKLRKF